MNRIFRYVQYSSARRVISEKLLSRQGTLCSPGGHEGLGSSHAGGESASSLHLCGVWWSNGEGEGIGDGKERSEPEGVAFVKGPADCKDYLQPHLATHGA